jgi:ATP-binding cassette subfamily B protein
VRDIADRMRLVRVLAAARPLPLALLTAALLIQSMIPAATAAALAFLVGELGEAAEQGTRDVFAVAIVPLAVFAAVLVLGHLAEAVVTPLEQLAAARIDGRHRTEVTRLVAATDTIAAVEDPKVQVLVRQALADRSRGYVRTPADGALAQLRWAARLVGAAAACAVLASLSWWRVPLVLLPAAANRMIRTRDNLRLIGHWREATEGELHADVWRNAAVSPAEGKDVRVFGFADWMVDRMQDHIRQANHGLWRHVDRMLRLSWRHALIVAAGLVPAYVAVAVSAADGRTTVAVATAVLTAGWSLFLVLGPSSDMYDIASGIRVLKATDELRAALAERAPATRGELPPPDSPGPAPLVRFEKVSFGYPTTGRAVLRDLDLEIRPGELLAIVGLNGAGKSTLIKLLAGLYRPRSGRITVDGVDLARLDPDLWRAKLSIVFQDFVRYRLTARDNVALGQAHLPPDQRLIDAAAASAGLADVLDRLPDGWDTPLSRSRTGGVDLSGGQWQQVVLARALYAVRRGARLLVLDEPTAHLDVRTEFEVFNRLAANRGETSVVLISHRLSTVRQADRIVLLDGGRITESGTHDELMALGGTYAEMFAIQAERFRRGHDDRIEEVTPR